MAIIELQRRQTEVGRIRLGQKVTTQTGRTAPARLETFRFTSPSRPLIDAIARLYGGDAQPWAPPKGASEWEVVTTTNSVPVLVPPQDVDSSQFYEHWSAGGCQRRCTGVRELIGDTACVCDPDNRECKMHTRINLMLRDVPGIGVWRLDTGGYYAGVELPGMVELLSRVQGLVDALLELRQRTVTRDGKTKHFVVPVLHVEDFTPGQLMSGQVVGHAVESGPARTAIAAASESRDERTKLDFDAEAHAATDVATVQRLWKEAARAGVLDDQLAVRFKGYAAALAPAAPAGDEPPPPADPGQPGPEHWLAQMRAAQNVPAHREVWARMKAAGVDDPALNAAWWARKKTIESAAAGPVEAAEVEPDKDATWTAILSTVNGFGWSTSETSRQFREFTGFDVAEASGWQLEKFLGDLRDGVVTEQVPA